MAFKPIISGSDQLPTFNGKAINIFILREEEIKGISNLSEENKARLSEQIKKSGIGEIWQSDLNIYIKYVSLTAAEKEKLRIAGNKVIAHIVKEGTECVNIQAIGDCIPGIEYVAEGLALGAYEFKKYKKDQTDKNLKINLIGNSSSKIAQKLQCLVNSVFWSRDMINEPLNKFTAAIMAQNIEENGKISGFSVEVKDKKWLTEKGFGGILSVALGGKNDPLFLVLTYNGKSQETSAPVVLIGKGVVYDTGGLSLKPTPGSMDMMKCDMAGAATVAGTIRYCAEQKLPVHLVGLLPLTENRPGEDAMVPGDVIHIYGGKSVEVLNTDAEGRLILADALVYAAEFNPSLVIDLATLTGAAVRTLGKEAAAMMGTADKSTKESLIDSGFETHERLVELPLWSDYAHYMESDLADIKNIGADVAGAITAGKFLEFFVAFPWIHLDIAGTAFLSAPDHYRPKGGTGTGIRLLIDFLLKTEQQ